MTELLDRAADLGIALPPALQDEVARMIVSFAGGSVEIVALTPDERAAIEPSRKAASRVDFATEEEARAVWTSMP